MAKFKPYIIILLIGTSFLSARNYASYAGGFLRMGSSARAMAMGSGFSAEIDPGFAAYHNPASMVYLSKRQLGFSHHFLPLDRRFMAANVSFPIPPSASLGLAWISAGVDKIDGRSTVGEHTQYLSTSEDAFIISFAQRILPWFSVGLNIKILNQKEVTTFENTFLESIQKQKRWLPTCPMRIFGVSTEAVMMLGRYIQLIRKPLITERDPQLS